MFFSLVFDGNRLFPNFRFKKPLPELLSYLTLKFAENMEEKRKKRNSSLSPGIVREGYDT
jgi:hypothetical protein